MRQDLGGKWTLNSLDERNIRVAADVPGDTHSALLAAGEISDPYWAKNELDVQWVGRTDWSFSRLFHVKEDLLARKAVYLVCESIDTVAQIFINGNSVAAVENMFLRFRADVKPFLKAGENEIEIRIVSAVREAKKRADAYGSKLHPATDNPPAGYEAHANLLRKVACHFGWDWGICLAASGIYDGIFLHGVDDARIEYVYTDQKHGDDFCELVVNAEVIAPSACEVVYEVAVGDVRTSRRVALAAGINKVSAVLRIDDPDLWWPAGYGAQPLYDLKARVGEDCYSRKLGLRKLEVNHKEDDIGRPLTFRVNGVDVFCKGANWIPLDAMPARHTRERYENLIDSAVAANMNMLRIWGGGQYEKDCFYELCDARGVLVWQDFMFACAEYPSGDRRWAASVRCEAEHQIKRLRDYACIALWCGDNENLGILLRSADLLPSWMRHYDRLNYGILKVACDEHDPHRLFWPSSPCAGPEELLDTFNVQLRGDMHCWDVWHGDRPFEDYYKVKPRFCSEFGFQALPSMETIASFAPEDQWNIGSPVFALHQRHRRGNSIITQTIMRYFRLPEGFASFAYLTQVQQALAMQTAVEYWRTLRPLCMGTLYWQLNDNWPVCSWSSLEYGGKWKLIHHAARRFYAPLMATAFCRDSEVMEFWAVNDGLEDRRVELLLAVRDFSGNILNRENISCVIPAAAAVELKKTPLTELAPDREKAFVTIHMHGDSGTFENMSFLEQPKNCALAEAEVSVRAGADADGLFVTLSSDKPAFYAVAETMGVEGEFDDNMILLLPDSPRTLRFKTKTPPRPDELEKAVSIRHLRATY